MLIALPVLLGKLNSYRILANSQIPAGAQQWNGHYYMIINKKMTPVEAEKYCKKLGGYLVTITSQQEQAFVAAIAEKGAEDNYFIGATDFGDEGNWRWMNGEKWAYTNWYQGGSAGLKEPNNGLGSGEDYAVKNRARNWQWVDVFGGYDNYTNVSSAFAGCEELSGIEIPETVESIGERCFQNCYELDFMEAPEGVTEIGERTFDGCVSLLQVSLLESLEYIQSYAFSESGLESVVIPKNATHIAEGAFAECSDLKSAYALGAVEYNIMGRSTIDSSIFNGCESLTIYAPQGSDMEFFASQYEIPFSVAENALAE